MASRWCRAERKKKYKRESLALNALEKVKFQRFDDGKHMSTYRCEECGKWHFGHTPGMSDIVRLPRRRTA